MAKKEKKEEKEPKVFEVSGEYLEKRAVYPLAFRNIDTLIAFNEYNETTGELVKCNRGVLSGSLITYIGVSGAGKTTLAAEHMANMMRPFIREKNTDVKAYIIDNESGLVRNRFKNITNFTNEEIRAHVSFEVENSIEYLNRLTIRIIKEKENMKKMEVEGYTGEKIKILPPTFIFIDALSEMIPEELTEEEKADNKMLYMTQARLIDQYFKKFKNQFVKYNINMLCIAHISKKMNLDNPMSRPSREFKALPADMKINGGKNFLYNTDIGIYISSIIANGPDAIEKKCSAGYLNAFNIMEAVLWKNRQGRDNVTFNLVGDVDGFNPLKSFIYECTVLKVIESAGGVRKLKGYDKSFRSGEMIEKFILEPEFRKALYDAYDQEKKYIFEASKKGKAERDKAVSILDLMNE